MIRRDGGDSWLLIQQHDHAQLAGELLSHIGGRRFERPDDRVILGASLHDAGWPLHDDQPTLNAQGQPLHIFETPREVSIAVWNEAVRRVPQDQPYAALLVSIHVLSLSALAVSHARRMDSPFRMDERNSVFSVNKFQHGQFEIQEKLRARLGLRLDVPLTLGLADDSSDPQERQLLFDYRMVAAADLLSLALCCDEPPMKKIDPVSPAPGARNMPLYIKQTTPGAIQVDPWPFEARKLELAIPYRRLPRQTWNDAQSFLSDYAAAPQEQLILLLDPVSGWW